jgi:hypothetical protein
MAMTNEVARLYTLSATILVFFVAWAGIAADPWVAAPDRSLVALARREQRLRRDADIVRLIARRRAEAASRARAASAPAPTVRVVQLPPVTTSRSS